ncbi:hypothetical protein [Kitasatospora sp. NPDC059571]|uniref:hypothetical protein n=1 Tax=Kitasatospora sp. NPDC059571 TaxID=3346871 RepID=UPI003681ABB8
MRAQARAPFTCYHNYELHSVQAGDVLDGDLAEYALATGCPVDELTDDDGQESEGDPRDGELDITAPTAAVLAWVGDDKDRAAQALAAEKVTEKPRTGLVTALEKLAPADES